MKTISASFGCYAKYVGITFNTSMHTMSTHNNEKKMKKKKSHTESQMKRIWNIWQRNAIHCNRCEWLQCTRIKICFFFFFVSFRSNQILETIIECIQLRWCVYICVVQISESMFVYRPELYLNECFLFCHSMKYYSCY